MSKGKALPPVVDPTQPVDYSRAVTPSNYVCHGCRASGCKLWRRYQTFLSHQTLLCANCTARDQKKDITGINENGLYRGEAGGVTDSIGWFIPAVPTSENDTYWGYSSIPADGRKWWRSLPTLPANVG